MKQTKKLIIVFLMVMGLLSITGNSKQSHLVYYGSGDENEALNKYYQNGPSIQKSEMEDTSEELAKNLVGTRLNNLLLDWSIIEKYRQYGRQFIIGQDKVAAKEIEMSEKILEETVASTDMQEGSASNTVTALSTDTSMPVNEELSFANSSNTLTVTSAGIGKTDGGIELPKDLVDLPEYIGTDYERDFRIVKYYQMTDKVLETTTTVGVYTTLNATHNINIKDEQKKNNFKLTEWFITDADWTPSTESIDELDYYSVKADSNVVQDGALVEDPDTTIVIPLSEAPNNKVLHILYEYTPIDTVVKVNKIIIDGDVTSIVTEEIARGFDDSYNTQMDGYTCTAIRAYQDELALPDITEQMDVEEYLPTTDTNDYKVITPKDKIQLSRDYNNIYIVYTKNKLGKLELYSNEISHIYKLADFLTVPFTVYYYIPSALTGGATSPQCTHETKCTTQVNGKYLTDNRITLSVTDKFDYNAECTYISDYRLINKGLLTKTYSTTWSGGNGESLKLYPNAKFVLYRDSSKETLTLYPNKNSDIAKGILSQFGITEESYTPVERGETLKHDTFTDENYKLTMQSHWEEAENADRSLSWAWQMTNSLGQNTEVNHGDYEVKYETGHSPEDLNEAVALEDNIQIDYYMLKSNDAKGQILGLNSKKVEYYPYYAMKFQYFDNNTEAEATAYVTSNAKNQIVLNDYYKIQCNLQALWRGRLGKETYNVVKMRYVVPCIADLEKDSIVTGAEQFTTTSNAQTDAYLNTLAEGLGVIGATVVTNINHTYSLKIQDDGTLKILKDGDVLYSGDKSEFKTVTELKLLDDYSYNITNYIASLKSSETTFNRSGETWLQECYDAINMIEYYAELQYKKYQNSLDYIKKI